MASESDSSAPSRVIIQTFSNHDDAELAAAQLEANGIACWVMADDCGGLLPNLALAGGVRLLVSRSDEAAATTLLQPPEPPFEPRSEFSGQNELVSEEPPTRASHQPRKVAVGQILIGVVIGVLADWFYQQPANPARGTQYHYAANGKADAERIYRHGKLVEYLEDRNLDGAWDRWSYYGALGLERVEYDNNFDGKPDETWTYSDGDLLTMQKDVDFNGIPDEFCTYKYHILQQMDMRPNDSKFTTLREFFTNGVLSEIWRGGDSSGNFKEVVKYDPFFNPLSTNILIHPLLSVP